MRQFMLCTLALAIAGFTFGCGGSVSQKDVITIRDLDFQPRERTVKVGTTVTWVNAGNQTHTIVSGTLLPITFPKTFDVSVLDNLLTPPELGIRLGDTIRFTNLSPLPRQIEVKDSELKVQFLSPILLQNDSTNFKPTRAGTFTAHDSESPAVRMDITVTGIPNPDGKFASGVLVPAQEFKFKFTTTGAFPYFCGVHNIENGVVIVEP